MNSDEHRAFYTAFAQELRGSGINEAGGHLPTAILEFDPSRPERIAEQFNFPSDIKAGLVESALSENRRVLRFHGEIAAGLDLDHHSRSRGDKVSLRFRFKHMTGTRYVICTVGDSRVPVRLVNEDGTLFLCGENTKENCGPLASGWNTVSIESGGEITAASVNGVEVKHAKHQPKGTWIYLGQGYREGSYPVDGAFEIDVSSVGTRVRR